jgi:hypothetical protein
MKHAVQNMRDKLHGGEVVIVKQHLEHGGFFGLHALLQGQTALGGIFGGFVRAKSLGFKLLLGVIYHCCSH